MLLTSRGRIHNWMKRKQINFGAKEQQKSRMDKQYWKKNNTRRTEYSEQPSKSIKLENARTWWHIWILVFKKSLPSMTARLSKWIDAYKKQTYTNRWQKKDHLNLKRPSKRNRPNNYRPTTCLPMMWKIQTAQIREEIYESLISHGTPTPRNRKGDTSGQHVHQHILKES